MNFVGQGFQVLNFYAIFWNLFSGNLSLVSCSTQVLQKHFKKRSILNYPARCGVSKVSYRKSTVMYKWEVQGLIKYLDYVQEFDENFIHETDHVKFTSPEDLNGLWKFKVHSSKNPNEAIPHTFVSAKYTYEETPKNQRMNIGMLIKIMYGPLYSTANELIITKPSDKYVQKVKTITNLITTPKSAHVSNAQTLPLAKLGPSSARRVLPSWFSTSASSSEEEEDDDEKRKDTRRSKDREATAKTTTEKFVEINRVTVTFDSGNIQPLLNNLRKQTDNTNTNDEFSAVDFTFIINYFIPNDPIVTEQMKCYIGNFTHQLTSFGGIGIVQQPPGLESESGTKIYIARVDSRNSSNKTESKTTTATSNESKNECVKTTLGNLSPDFAPFVSNLENIFVKAEFSDMNVVAHGVNFPVHRMVLANSGPNLAQKVRTLINLSDFRPFPDSVGSNATREILRYIYTGHAKDLEILADQIIIGAHQIGLTELEKMCTTLLMNDINAENAIRMYSLAKDVDSDSLTKAVVAVIRENKQAVISQSKEFQKLAAKYPAIIFDLFIS